MWIYFPLNQYVPFIDNNFLVEIKTAPKIVFFSSGTSCCVYRSVVYTLLKTSLFYCICVFYCIIIEKYSNILGWLCVIVQNLFYRFTVRGWTNYFYRYLSYKEGNFIHTGICYTSLSCIFLHYNFFSKLNTGVLYRAAPLLIWGALR